MENQKEKSSSNSDVSSKDDSDYASEVPENGLVEERTGNVASTSPVDFDRNNAGSANQTTELTVEINQHNETSDSGLPTTEEQNLLSDGAAEESENGKSGTPTAISDQRSGTPPPEDDVAIENTVLVLLNEIVEEVSDKVDAAESLREKLSVEEREFLETLERSRQGHPDVEFIVREILREALDTVLGLNQGKGSQDRGEDAQTSLRRRSSRLELRGSREGLPEGQVPFGISEELAKPSDRECVLAETVIAGQTGPDVIIEEDEESVSSITAVHPKQKAGQMRSVDAFTDIFLEGTSISRMEEVHAFKNRRLMLFCSRGMQSDMKPILSRDMQSSSLSTYSDRSVEITAENSAQIFRKPYLGGYRNLVTQIEYHHASTQTDPLHEYDPTIPRNTRETQTYVIYNKSEQVVQDSATQTLRPGIYISTRYDRILQPGQCTLGDEFLSGRLAKIILLQSYIRRWLAQKRVNRLRLEYGDILAWRRAENRRMTEERLNRLRMLQESRARPTTDQDFDILYDDIQEWMQRQLEEINRTKSGAERKAALCGLLEQEEAMLSYLTKLQQQARFDVKEKNVNRFLDQTASSLQWESYKGHTIDMETPHVVRARELRELFLHLQQREVKTEARLDLLQFLKKTIWDLKNDATREILELIEREIELMSRGVREENLQGLRTRICTLFFHLLHSPEFNPQVENLQNGISKFRGRTIFCNGCGQYRPSKEFVSTKARSSARCRACLRMQDITHACHRNACFRFILRHLQREEEKLGNTNGVAYIMQEMDIAYLVQSVWNGQSALSTIDELLDLVLCRWDKTVEWTPWNCILLTIEEAQAHLKLDDLEQVYGPTFHQKVRFKHSLARNYFFQLPSIAAYLTRED